MKGDTLMDYRRYNNSRLNEESSAGEAVLALLAFADIVAAVVLAVMFDNDSISGAAAVVMLMIVILVGIICATGLSYYEHERINREATEAMARRHRELLEEFTTKEISRKRRTLHHDSGRDDRSAQRAWY